MPKSLVLAEKPSVGRDLARVLGARRNGNGCISGDKYVITWALGHLVTLCDHEYYGAQYKTWNLDTLPMLPKKMELNVIKDTSKQYGIVKNLMRDPQINEIIIATDAGREGELVARWIIEKAGIRKPIKRLWISSQTDKAIKEGFAKLQNGSAYENLFHSAKCRAEADWLVGLNVTRALTCKFNAQLSAGRVQTPTLALMTQREDEIRKFVPKDYYTISAKLNGFNATWRDIKGQVRLYDENAAAEIQKKVKSTDFRVCDLKKDIKRESAPLLYDLTELQRDANKRYGFSAKKTLNIMQKLYEIHKILTYPRTDSRYLTTDIIPTLTERLKSIAIGPYAERAKEIIRNKYTIPKKFADNAKVSDHHAIIPTEQYVNLSNLEADEKYIYDLVVKRFLSAFLGDFVYEQLTVTLKAGNEFFGARGKMVQSKGWKAVYDRQIADNDDSEDEKEQELPPIKRDEIFKAHDVKVINGKTKPPSRYTEATLLSAMEHPGKFIADSKMREIIDSTSGLGTPATRAEIIERLLSAFYVERRGNSLVPTSKGIQLINIVPPDLKEPELTAKWERELLAISKGKADRTVFMNNIRSYTTSLVGKVIASENNFRHDNLSGEKCPNCDKMLLEVNGKKGKMLVCQDRECGYRKSVSFISHVKCPECHKALEIFGEGEKKKFICKCGFREKYDTFSKRLEENKKNMSKREVEQYLKNQNAPKPNETSAFGAALEAALKAMKDKN